MRTLYSYLRMLIASSLFMGGLALQFVPSPAAVARDARWRDQQIQAVPAEERAQWLHDRDLADARSEASLRVFGVLLGGIGLAGVMLEAAYLSAQYNRRS